MHLEHIKVCIYEFIFNNSCIPVEEVATDSMCKVTKFCVVLRLRSAVERGGQATIVMTNATLDIMELG